MKWCRKGAEMNPEDWFNWSYLGRAYRKRGDHDGEIQTFENAVAKIPRSLVKHTTQMAILLRRLERTSGRSMRAQTADQVGACSVRKHSQKVTTRRLSSYMRRRSRATRLNGGFGQISVIYMNLRAIMRKQLRHMKGRSYAHHCQRALDSSR